MTNQWRIETRYIVGVAVAMFLLFVAYLSRSVIYILLGSLLISLILRPLIKLFIDRLRFPRSAAVLVAHLIGGLAILVAPLVLIPPILDAISALLNIDYQALIDDGLHWLEGTLIFLKNSNLHLLGFSLLLDSIIDPLLNYLQGVSPAFQPSLPSYNVIIDSLASAFTVSYGIAVSLVGSVFSGVVSFLFLIIASIYISLDGNRFYSSFLNWFPEEQRDEMDELAKRIKLTWDAFFRGQFLLMVIIGVTVWLGLTIMGIPGAFALGFIAGVLEIVPSLGPVLSAIPAVIVALLQGSMHFDINNWVIALIVIGFYILVQAFENYFVVPQVLGGAVKLHPLIVIAGVLIGATIWGILGALLAAPIIASFREVVSYLHRKILGQEPFPEEPIPIDQEINWRESMKALILRGQRLKQTGITFPLKKEKDAGDEVVKEDKPPE